MLFKEIIGQDDIKNRLISETKAGRISHAKVSQDKTKKHNLRRQ